MYFGKIWNLLQEFGILFAIGDIIISFSFLFSFIKEGKSGVLRSRVKNSLEGKLKLV